MDWFGKDHKDTYDAFSAENAKPHHEAKFTHELIAGAASYEAARAYEKHCEKNGKPPSHDKAKALLAGFAGAFVDKMVESKGLDYLDTAKLKHDAHEHAKENLANDYGHEKYNRKEYNSDNHHPRDIEYDNSRFNYEGGQFRYDDQIVD
ncbi:hypothetical protein C8R47DRAFT_1197495 [Mycena vitilis]|nr:hypothetical protein C8R47DRAFT_1197495 [Mycena vitilis]